MVPAYGVAEGVHRSRDSVHGSREIVHRSREIVHRSRESAYGSRESAYGGREVAYGSGESVHQKPAEANGEWHCVNSYQAGKNDTGGCTPRRPKCRIETGILSGLQNPVLQRRASFNFYLLLYGVCRRNSPRFALNVTAYRPSSP